MIIVGLGNPGKEYEGTRHNVGFEVLDEMIKKFPDASWQKEFGVDWYKINNHYLVKPQEYMNASGTTLNSFIQKKGIPIVGATTEPLLVLVIHDDLDFPLGEIHEQLNRSAGGHNGIQSIIDALGTQNFSRLRIGIGNNRELNIPAEAYVLQKFSTEERLVINTAIDTAAQIVKNKIQV